MIFFVIINISGILENHYVIKLTHLLLVGLCFLLLVLLYTGYVNFNLLIKKIMDINLYWIKLNRFWMHFPMEFINVYDISSSRFDEYKIKPVFIRFSTFQLKYKLFFYMKPTWSSLSVTMLRLYISLWLNLFHLLAPKAKFRKFYLFKQILSQFFTCPNPVLLVLVTDKLDQVGFI
jgi:hypothetical protein